MSYPQRLDEMAQPRGPVQMNSQDALNVKVSTLASEIDNGNSGAGPVNIDWSAGIAHKLRLTGSPTLTFTPPPGPCWLQLLVVQDDPGSRTITWPTVRWAGGAAPTLTSAADSEDIVVFYYDGTTYRGSATLNFA